MFDVIAFSKALVPTFFISRVLLWTMGMFVKEGFALAFLANFISLAFIAAIYFAEGYSNFGFNVAWQALWFIQDICRCRCAKSTIES